MSERNGESFDLEDDFLGENPNEESSDLDRMIVVERRPKGLKRPVQQAAWSRVEDVIEERRLRRELSEFLDGDDG